MTEEPHAKLQKRKLNPKDVESIIELLAKRITETGACLMLGIEPRTWFKWKDKPRNKLKFAALLERARETKLAACIDAISKSGDDSTITIQTDKGVKTIDRKGDWRAKSWLCERILAPDRLGEANSPGEAVATQALADISKAMLIALSRQANAVVACPPNEQKQIVQDVETQGSN
jgi:hypothetical protein